MEKSFSYCIITPVFNEETFLSKTIESVLNQTATPKRWLIVDDGSTDGTAEIIKKYAEKYGYITYHFRQKPSDQAYYASNVHAIMDGWRLLQEERFDYLAILDADITLPGNYYEKILTRFDDDDKLGVASGIYENLVDGQLHSVLNDRRSTPKAIQVFRREVFLEIGGFLPLKYGGEDTVACIMARMAGWKAWSYPDIKVVHHRPTGMGQSRTILRVRINQGRCEYSLATHPLFFILKCLRRAGLEKPYLLGSLCRLIGYLTAALRREERLVPRHVAKFSRREQLERIFSLNKVM